MTKSGIWSIAILFCALFSATTLNALATDYYWNVADGDWSVGTNWDPVGLPAYTDYTYIDNGGVARISSDQTIERIYAGFSNSSTAVVEQTDGTTTVYVLSLAAGHNSTATYNLVSGSISGLDSLGVGVKGSGEFNQLGGSVEFNFRLYLGSLSGSSGTYNLSDGYLYVDDEYVGGNHSVTPTTLAKGYFYQTGGVHEVIGDFRVGDQFLSEGHYYMSAGTLHTVDGNIGYYGGTGEFYQSGGTYTVDEDLYVGNGASGTYTQTGGTLSIGDSLYISYNSNAYGVFELSGTGQISVGPIYVGYHGTGEFYQSGNAILDIHGLKLGADTGSHGTYNLSSGELNVFTEHIGDAGVGVFMQTGGSHTAEYLRISTGSTCFFQGGTLDVDYLYLNGTLDFMNGAVELHLKTDSDLSQGTILNAGSATLKTDQNTLTIFAAGFVPENEFASVDAQGLLYTLGNTLVVHQGISYTGDIDIDDDLEVRGTVFLDDDPCGFNNLTIAATGRLVHQLDYVIEDGQYFHLHGGTLENYQSIAIEQSAYINDGGVGGMIEVWNDFINLSDMSNEFDMRHTTLILHGNIGWDEEYEVWNSTTLDMNSADFGATVAGLDSNFAIGNLVFSGAEGTSVWYRLESDIYCYGLSIEEGAVIDLNGYNIYYMPQGCGAYSAIHPGTFRLDGICGELSTGELRDPIAITDAPPVPEPATIVLLGAGALALAGAIRKRIT